MKPMQLSKVYYFIPLLNRIWNFILIPIAFHVMSASNFVQYSNFFLYSFLLGILLDFGFRQKVLNKRLTSTSSFLSYGGQTILAIAILSISVIFITLVFQKSNLSITIAVLILASLDAILQSIILNGYLANLVVFNLEDKFKNLSAIYGLYFFTIRLFAIVVIHQLFQILIFILICKLIAIIILHLHSKHLKINIINNEGQNRFYFKDQYSYNTIFSIATLLILCSDRIIGNASLTDEEMANYFLIYQYVSSVGSVFEQYVTLHFKTLVKVVESVEKIQIFFKSWVVIVPLASYIGAFLANFIYHLYLPSAFNVFFFQLLNALLWLLYLVLMLSVNANAKNFRINAKIHVLVLTLSCSLWSLSFHFGTITFGSLACFVYLSFSFLITLQLVLGTPQIKIQLRSRIIGQIALANTASLLVLIFNSNPLEYILILSNCALVSLQLAFLLRFVGMRFSK